MTGTAVGLVAQREIVGRLRTKAFKITTIITLVLIVGGVIAAKLVSGTSSVSTVGFSGPTAALAPVLTTAASSVGQSVTTSVVTDPMTAEQQVRDGTLDVLVEGTPGELTVVVNASLNPGLANAFTALAQRVVLDGQIAQLGGDPAKVNNALATAKVQVRELTAPQEFDGQRIALGMIAGILIYLTLLVWGQAVAQGVVEEKSSRVVELLLATIRPWQLMAGKVLGIGAVGLIQMVLFGAVGIGAGLGAGVLTIPTSAALGTVLWLAIWYLLGFLAYALVFAAAGALVSRQEDVGAVISPILMLIILPYVLGASILPTHPGSTLIEVLSVIPMFSPMLMPMRLALGGVPVWEIVLSLGLIIGLIPALVWLSGRVYRNAVLRGGARVKLRDALRAV